MMVLPSREANRRVLGALSEPDEPPLEEEEEEEEAGEVAEGAAGDRPAGYPGLPAPRGIMPGANTCPPLMMTMDPSARLRA